MVLREVIPLAQSETGELYVEGTRVFLEDLLEAYERGLSPEEMVLAYPSLRLEDVYLVLAYALRHPEEVEAYRRRQEARAREAEAQARRFLPRELLSRLGKV
ncbi:DUF433 domain-containing protein [Thermus composti]|uniref:DUF433 domain-containing protein n=1 Tax=Thermus composti TaxID=532059 RepID=A0ABV6Q1M1_9DEIN|nr:DUF433 domain-containing protein [Thermus composti]